MEPIKFRGCNCIYAEDQKGYLSLPAYKHGDDQGSVSACWKATFRERLKIFFTGKIYVTLLSFNKPLTPHRLDVNSPVIEEVNNETS